MKKMLIRSLPPPAPGPSPVLTAAGRVWRHEIPSKLQLRQGLWVSSVGYHTNLSPHKLVQDRVMDCYAAVLVTRGHGYYASAATGRRDVGPGTLMWVVPGVTHSYSPTGATWDEHWVVFGGTLADELATQGLISASHPLVKVGSAPEVNGIFARMEEAFLRGGPLAVAMASSLTYQLIVTVHGVATGLLHMDQNLDPAIAKTLQIIEQEAVLGLSPRSLANRVHVGYSTLRRRFKQQTGYSVKEYILRLQLRHAKELLAATSKSIAEVADEIGIENALYFSRLFSEREGVSPRTFRKQHRRAETQRAGKRNARDELPGKSARKSTMSLS
jgi:AraC-like DNA-binding protein